MNRFSMFVSVVFVLTVSAILGACVPEVAAQAVIHVHPGWLDSATQEGFDVAEGWPYDENDCCWQVGQYDLIGTYTKGTEPPGQVGESAFWNSNHLYPEEHSLLWMMGLEGGAILESIVPIEINAERPWLFVQFYGSDMNDGLAEIAVQEVGEDNWFTVGSYDTFGRRSNWVSIEGLPLGSYYVRITSRWDGRTRVAPPNNGCGIFDKATNLQPARMGRTAVVPQERIHLTGGGWLPIEGGKATFSIDIAFTGGNDRPTGTFTYVDHVLKARVQSTEILGMWAVGDEARITLAVLSSFGTNHTVYAHVFQGGAGVGILDIQISRDWSKCRGEAWVYEQQLTLGGGQIKLH
jgi:hypothetical protein